MTGAADGRPTACQKTFREVWRARKPSKVNSYRPALPGGRGVYALGRKHFLSFWRKRPPQADFFDKLKGRRNRRPFCVPATPPGGAGAFLYNKNPPSGTRKAEQTGRRYRTRSSPQKNRATVPGPVWLPMVVPMLLISTLPLSLGKRSSTRRATACASSMQAELEM